MARVPVPSNVRKRRLSIGRRQEASGIRPSVEFTGIERLLPSIFFMHSPSTLTVAFKNYQDSQCLRVSAYWFLCNNYCSLALFA
jgi:hypothetical protein